jgi:hypothetical protein
MDNDEADAKRKACLFTPNPIIECLKWESEESDVGHFDEEGGTPVVDLDDIIHTSSPNHSSNPKNIY